MKLPHFITNCFLIYRNLILVTFLTIVTTPFFTSCRNRRYDPRLERISDFVSESPEDALDSLGDIDESALDESNRAYFNLLTIKARDKAYIVHTSDSLILDVIGYYTKHTDAALTPEALYYGGRVYSDLGDFPTSLGYFQQALDMLPANTSNILLKGDVLSQMGGTIMDLGMFAQSIPYIKEVIKINKLTKDTLNLAYNNRMLGMVFMEMQKNDSADYYFRKSLIHLENLPPEFGIETQVFRAANKYECGDNDSALAIIRPTINQVSKEFKSYTLACASDIYLEADLLDTAYMISYSLVTDTTLNNRKSGYTVLLSPELRKFITLDSLEYFLSDYRKAMENQFHNRISEESLIQHSRYNYQVHDRKRREAEIRSHNIALTFLATVCCVLVILLGVLALLLKKRDKIIELQATINNLNKIIETLDIKKEEHNPLSQQENALSTEFDKASSEDQITEQSLKDDIKTILIRIQRSSCTSHAIPDVIISSEAYKTIRKYIAEKTLIPSSDGIWDELEKLVSEQSPEFLNRLRLLLGEFPDEQTLRIAMLIKCGISAAQTGRLLGRSKSTISYRRANLCAKILGEHSTPAYLDDVIRAL